ncbi:Sphingosine-1-phosphate phosphatase 2, partial [Ophiophagus hannah]
MGQEVFYITFLPFTYWIINAPVARRLIIMWSWPRPRSPPVVKLEKKTNAEYGMPSTHAMAATAISFTFVSVTANQYKYPLELGLLGAFLFSSLVGLSRIYTGMHTVLDVVVGSLISLFLTAISCPTWDIVDHLMLTSPFCPAFCIIVPLFLCYNYPKLDYYSPTRADTTTILGASAGAIIGFWANNHYGSNAASKGVIYSVSSITSEIILLVLAKCIVGIGVLMITRQFARTIIRKSLCSWHKVSNSDVVAMRQIKIEVPYKFITYSSIGLSATIIKIYGVDTMGRGKQKQSLLHTYQSKSKGFSKSCCSQILPQKFCEFIERKLEEKIKENIPAAKEEFSRQLFIPFLKRRNWQPHGQNPEDNTHAL